MQDRRARTLVTALLLLGAVAAGPGCRGSVPMGSTAAKASDGSTPAWLPPYSAEQLALLRPTEGPVTVPARRVFPDVSRFRHARDRILEDPRDALRVTRMVAEIVERSPRMYNLSDADPDLANTIAQYGPAAPDEPDAWLLAVRDDAGEVVLQRQAPSAAVVEAFERGVGAARAGRHDEAATAFRAAVEKNPRIPALRLGLARALEHRGPEEAERAYRDLLVLDPTLASAHEGLAAILQGRGDAPGARVSVAHALAYHPTSRRSLELAAKLALEPPNRVPPFAIFLDVDVMGAVRVASEPTTSARMYAGCRAVMRYEPELRQAIFDQSPNEPYFLSSVEEILCHQAALGAFLAERAMAREEGTPVRPDPRSEELLTLAHTEGLLGYVMFEILGHHRPEHARTAPPPVHRATVSYVQKHVLGNDPGPEQNLYVAAR